MALDGIVLTVPKGAMVPLAVRIANGTLIFYMTGDAAQAASSATGDKGNLTVRLLALLVSVCLATGIIVSIKKLKSHNLLR